ncbi:hypothetical protein Plhal304r1_c007g0028961 [Plasmopara halstedii]
MTVKAQMKMSNNKAAILLTKIPLPASKPVASESADVTLTVSENRLIPAVKQFSALKKYQSVFRSYT